MKHGTAVDLLVGLCFWMIVHNQTPTVVQGHLQSQSESDALECLALTLYWEAGGEPSAGLAAVGWVVLNRQANPDFPSTICQVVRQGDNQPGCQFTYSCDGNSDTPADLKLWSRVRTIAQEVIKQTIPDPTNGALFFHSDNLAEIPWAIPRERTAQIGNQIYYR